MNKLSNRGFTLIELIATIVILAIVMGIGSYAITEIISKSKDNEYKILIKEIKTAMDEYYIECMDPPKDDDGDYIINCPMKDVNGYYTIRLGDLVMYGYLTGYTSELIDGTGVLNNPLDNKNIGICEVKYKSSGGKILVDVVTTGDCPQNNDYSIN